MRTLGRIFLVLLIAVAAVVVWQVIQRESTPPWTGSQPGPQPGPPPGPQAGPAFVDVAIVGARGVNMQGSRFVEIRVENRGPATATSVNGSCSYRCASTGVSVAGQSFLQGGYLVPGASTVGLLGLTPCPDQSIYIECLLQPGYGVTDSDFGNNRWSGGVANR